MLNSMKRWAAAPLLAAAAAATLQAQPHGQWDFNDPSEGLKATVGSDLGFTDGTGGSTDQATTFGSTTSFSISDIGGEPAQVMQVPVNIFGMGYTLPTPPANGGGGYVNEYTLLMDVLFPAESDAKPRALLEADLALLDPDAEFFVTAANSLGTKQNAFGQVTPGTWHRLGIAVDMPEGGGNGDLRFYIDGVEVGSRTGVVGIDGRYALSPSHLAYLFSDDGEEGAIAYVNSIQLWDEALSKGQIRALGSAAAAGLPQELPPVPSGLERWIPGGGVASRVSRIGAVLAAGSTTIEDSSISLKLNGEPIANPAITRDGELITVLSAPQNLTPGATYTNEVTYTDSLGGQQSFSKTFTAALFFEDFESLVLGPGLEESHASDIGWTDVPPDGWVVDNSEMDGFDSGDLDEDGRPDENGMAEWFGWSFANKDWWVRADDQRRSEFTLATGTVAIADPDEWDDGPHPKEKFFNSHLSTPPIPLEGVSAGTAFLRFSSSWRPETDSDWTVEGRNNNQTAIITASYDGGAPVQLMKWDSAGSSPTYHDHNPNESVLLSLDNPQGAENVVLTFSLVDAGNDWWWAVDDITVNAGAAAPTITTDPVSWVISEGGTAVLRVDSTGTDPFSYQWKKDGVPINGATGQSFEASQPGVYTVVVSNVGGSDESAPATVQTTSASLAEDLVVHLKFDGNLNDTSGQANHGQPVGSPTFESGMLGQAVHIPSGADYVTLGTPADLNFGTDTDFSFSFWARLNALESDPALIGNKDWNSGGNQGYVVFSASNRRVAWNLSGPPGSRKDGRADNILTDDAWKHVAVTFDRDGNAVIYIDGQPHEASILSLAGNVTDVGTPEGLATNIGQDGTGSYGAAFNDLELDDFGIWRRLLTPQQVLAIYQAGLAGGDLSTAEFVPDAPTAVTGQWDFDGGNLNATVGEALQYRGDTEALTTFETMTIGGQPAQVMAFPAATPDQGYIMPHGADPNGGGEFVNDYTLLIDLMFPEESDGVWRGLWQTGTDNANDSDLFVNPDNGIGISGNYSGAILPGVWHRVVFVVSSTAETLSKYIDGVLVGQQDIEGVDGRFSLESTGLLFTDEGNETALGYVNSIQFRNGAMTEAEVAALGGATAGGLSASAPEAVTLSIARSGSDLAITPSEAGTYQLQKKNALSDASWTNVGSAGSGPFNVPAEGDAGFFRVQKQ